MAAFLQLSASALRAATGRRLRRDRVIIGWKRKILVVALLTVVITTLLTRILFLYLSSGSARPWSIVAFANSSVDRSTLPFLRNRTSFLPYSSNSSEEGIVSPSSSILITNFDVGKGKINGLRTNFIHSSNLKNHSLVTNSSEGNKMASASSVTQMHFRSLPPDEALIYAKKEITNAPLVNDDPDLYASLFLNVSIFKRSYELMEKILKVYIYRDGRRPIFHTPELKGIYASEGWFMKLIEQNKHFVVKDPGQAHLFYLPYSARRMELALYVPGSHDMKPLSRFLRDYVNRISSKYPFWNRTRGSDHFLVACHDWLSRRQGVESCKHGGQELNYFKGELFPIVRGTPKSKLELLTSGMTRFSVFEDQSTYTELKLGTVEPDDELDVVNEDESGGSTLSHPTGRTAGKPGFISFHGLPYESRGEIPGSSPGKEKSRIFWFVGPTVMVAFLVLPSLYLRMLLSTVFEDSLLTDFLILFFIEALFYGGVAIFVSLVDFVWRPLEMVDAKNKDWSKIQFGLRISSVTTLALSLIIPLVTMGMVWPWTGPAASATLAPYLVGLVVQFAFEQYARHHKSPAWPVIPIIFQVYRLHQLNRAAQLVTALSFSVRGSETTPQTLAINSSLGTLLTVLQILGVICIWSLSSFLMRFLPPSVASLDSR